MRDLNTRIKTHLMMPTKHLQFGQTIKVGEYIGDVSL